jgi:Flp pilus assembly protein TadD
MLRNHEVSHLWGDAMRKPLVFLAATLLGFFGTAPAWAQKQGAPSQSTHPTGNVPSQPGQPIGQNPSVPQMQTPLYVSGRVLMDTGQPVPEPVSVELSCGMGVVQVIRTDLKGYFQFVLGAGPQGNMDLSAANETPMDQALGMSGNAGFGVPGNGGMGLFANLAGCELRVSVDGFQPSVHPIVSPPDLQTIDVGTFHLARIAGVQGSAISVTSLLVPGNARKEFEKGENDARSRKFNTATEHFQKAVAEYDGYAAAWTELGRMYAIGGDAPDAHEAFNKAIAADPKYIPPYLNLASLQLEGFEYTNAINTAVKVLALNPSAYVASYLQAVGYFRLGRLDEAEKSARDSENTPRNNFPQAHALLADIFMQKQDMPNAANEMRAYLKEAPKGPLAPAIKKKLAEIDPSSAGSDAVASSQQHK